MGHRGRSPHGATPVRPPPPEPLVPHTRQFVLGAGPRLIRPDWIARRLDTDLWLSHCPRLPVTERREGILIGTAVATDESDVPDSWAGRWVLIERDSVRLDACGTLGVFHAGGWASSSPALLDGEPEPPLSSARGAMEWYPPPRSGKRGVARLLPSQVLHAPSGRITPRRLLPGSSGSPEQRLVTAMRRLDGPLWLPLTGGHDSRTLPAAASAAGVEVTTFTFISERTNEADRLLPPRLAAALGYAHHAFPAPPEDPKLVAVFEQHAAGHTVDGPRRQVPRRLWDLVPRDAIVLGGACFGLARTTYQGQLPAVGGDAEQMAQAVLAFRAGDAEGTRAWTGWIEDHPEPMDWRDRWYIEQRIAGWLSSNAQGVDITGRVQIHLANCAAFLAELLAVPVERRAGGADQIAMIERLAPELRGYPVNPKRVEPPARGRWWVPGRRR